MRLDLSDQIIIQRIARCGDAEGSVRAIASGAAGDLTDLLSAQGANALAVELGGSGESHMVDIHVEAHADGVGGHQEIDLAGLIERDLGIARARRERAHHHRRPAALATDQFGDRVDRLGRKRDHGAAP